MDARLRKPATIATSLGLAIGLTLSGTGLAGAQDSASARSSHYDDDRVTDPAVIAKASAAALAAVPGGTVVKVETDDDRGVAYEVELRDSNGREVEVKLDSQFNVVRVENDDDDHNGSSDHDGSDDDDRVTNSAVIAKASAAALKAVPGATVLYVETEDGRRVAYEVKLIDADGKRVEVYLDSGFQVVRVKEEGRSYRQSARAAAKEAVPGRVRRVRFLKGGDAKYKVIMRSKGKRVVVVLDASYDVIRIRRAK